MHSPLFWIEWLDRLDRVLRSARQEVAILSRAVSPRGIEAIARSKRQLAVLTSDLHLMDRNVLAAGTTQDAADNLQKALDAAVEQLGSVAELLPASAPPVRDRALAAADSTLRDSCYEAANLLGPSRRAAAHRVADRLRL
ncbi:MAG TPA: hypothetical protein VGH12_06435 [Steroidobacteraceae bacterium]|jgi:hypothetical protein